MSCAQNNQVSMCCADFPRWSDRLLFSLVVQWAPISLCGVFAGMILTADEGIQLGSELQYDEYSGYTSWPAADITFSFFDWLFGRVASCHAMPCHGFACCARPWRVVPCHIFACHGVS